MKKIIYTRKSGKVSVVTPSSKERLEKVLGKLTVKQYRDHVWERAVPEDAINPRDLLVADIPKSREFRDAWEDSQEGSQVDICCSKAKEIQLRKLREEREVHMEVLDKDFMIAIEKGEDTSVIAGKKQALRDVTEPLKALSVEGKYNDAALLGEIKGKGVIR